MAAITSQTFHHAPSLNVPRGARLAAQAFLAGGRLLSRLISSALTSSNNTLAERSRAQEAQAVRNLASRYEKSDRGFASDLYAAAARHEGVSEH